MADDNAIKKSGTIVNYTQAQKNDLLKCALDPFYFIHEHVKIQHPIKGAVPFKTFPYQDRLIRAFHENRFSIGLTGRQLGKCLFFNNLVKYNDKMVEVGSLVTSSVKIKIIDLLESWLVKLSK